MSRFRVKQFFRGRRLNFLAEWLSSPKMVWKWSPKYESWNTQKVIAMLESVQCVSFLASRQFERHIFSLYCNGFFFNLNEFTDHYQNNAKGYIIPVFLSIFLK